MAVQTHEPVKILEYTPLIRTWMRERVLFPSTLKAVVIDTNMRRDYEREVAEQSQWLLHTPGEYVSVTLHTKTGGVYTKHFPAHEWKRQNEKEEEVTSWP